MQKVLCTILLFVCMFSAQADQVEFKSGFDITDVVDGGSLNWIVTGNVVDNSIVGFTGNDVTTGLLVACESPYGDIDVYRITNIVSKSVSQISVIVVYDQDGVPRVGQPVYGQQALCNITTNSILLPPSKAGCIVSDYLYYGMFNESFKRVGKGIQLSTNGLASIAFVTNLVSGFLGTNTWYSWLSTNAYIKVELDTVFTNWLATNPPMSDVAWTNWLETNTWIKFETDPIFTNWLSTNSYATTNWVDTDYYPRSNPSNYISTWVEADPLALHTGDVTIVAGSSSTGVNNSVVFGHHAQGGSYGVVIGSHAHGGTGLRNIAIGSSQNPPDTIIPDGFSDTVEIGNGTAVSNGWFHYQGQPVINQNGFLFSGGKSVVTNDTGDLSAYLQTNGSASGLSGCPSGAVATNNADYLGALLTNGTRAMAAEKISFGETSTDNIGFESVSWPVTGQTNSTWLGYYAAYDSFGSFNNAIGYAALYQSLGSKNNALGVQALFRATGTNNTAIGQFSMSESPGIYNSAVGADSLNHSSGDYNSAMGSSALVASDGSMNSALGYNALGQTDLGSLNSAVGYNAGKLSSGVSNLFLGANSGTSGMLTKYTNAITIGAGAVTEGPNATVIGSVETTNTHIFGRIVGDGLGLSGVVLTNSPNYLAKVSTNDTRTLDFTSGKFQNVINIDAQNTNANGSYGLMDNGVKIYGTNIVDKWVMWGDDTNVSWSMGTYRGENQQYFYLYNTESELPTWVVSRSGRHGVNHPDNIIDYHSLWSRTGIDDLDFGGINTAKQTYRYTVSIVSTGVVDTWTWNVSADMGATVFQYGATNNCATTNMNLLYGVTIAFGETNGHTIGQTWQKVAWSQLPSASMEVRPRRFQEELLGTNFFAVSGTDVYTDVSYDFGTGLAQNNILGCTNCSVWLGAKSPVNTFFWNILSPAAGLTLIAEYYNGSSWVRFDSVTNRFFDKTVNFTSVSGAEMQYEMSTTIQGKMCPAGKDASAYTLYWYRFRTSTTPTAYPVVQEVTPHGEKRLAVYKGMLNPSPSFWVGGRGNTYVDRAYMQDTTTAFTANQLITESRAQTIAKQANGTYYYPSTNIVASGVLASYQSPQSFNWILTNAVTANSTNNAAIRAYTNQTIGTVLGNTNIIPAGTRFTLIRQEAASGIAGFSSLCRYQLIEWNAGGLTNILATSGNSLVLPNNLTTPNEVTLTITTPTNITVTATTNYLAWRSQLVTSGNKAGTWLQWCGVGYNSVFIAGSVSSVAGSGIADAPSDNTLYGRSNGTWTAVTGGGGGGISDAPSDGQLYARQDAAWMVATNMGFWRLNNAGQLYIQNTTLFDPMWTTNSVGQVVLK